MSQSRLKDIESSYRNRAPAEDAPARLRVLYHVDRLVEFAWNANAYAESKAGLAGPQKRIGGMLKTDVFFCIQASAKLLGELLKTKAPLETPNGFKECWLALAALLRTLDNSSDAIDDAIARRAFFLIFVAAAIMRHSLRNADNQILQEDGLFVGKSFVRPEDERRLLKEFTISPFEGVSTSSRQLEVTRLNLSAIDQAIQLIS